MLLFLTAFAGGVFAQGTPVEQGKEEKAVSAAVESLRKAMIDPDKATLEKLTWPQLSYGHSNRDLQDQAAFVEALTSGKSDFVTIELSEQKIISIVDKTAIVRHVLTATTNNGGQPGQTKLSVLLVWQKDKGAWKLLARQAVKVVPAP